jgi:hypothetical protein
MSFENNRFAEACRDIKITGNIPFDNCGRGHIVENIYVSACGRGHIVKNIYVSACGRGHIVKNIHVSALENIENFSIFQIIKQNRR